MNKPLSTAKDRFALRSLIQAYKATADEIENDLVKNPQGWKKYTDFFNQELNRVFSQIMHFEKDQLAKGEETNVYKLKRIFVNFARKEFLRGDYIVWSLEKPYGYAGDFKIIEDIYKNAPLTEGLDRLFDDYFMASSISEAVRNRRDDFKEFIRQFLKRTGKKNPRIMNLGCGPCRELVELADEGVLGPDVEVHCYDTDQRAIDFSRARLTTDHGPQATFFKENVVRFALARDITQKIPHRYDMIYSTGLFDYFDDRVIKRLVENLRIVLNDGGELVISDVRDKYANPSVHFMEWVGDWNLIYRNDESFRNLFLQAGFDEKQLTFQYEKQKILQYVRAQK